MDDRDLTYFQRLQISGGNPSIDLFASRLNHQVSCYVSWKPDPGAAFIDAFLMLFLSHGINSSSMLFPLLV